MKERLKRENPEIYRALEAKIMTEMLSWELDEAMKRDIAEIHIETPEDDLIAFAKLWASYTEVYHNSLIYTDAYAKVIENIRSRSENPLFAPFLTYIDFDLGDQNNLERYLLVIHRLASSYRWNRSVRKYPVSVLSHTYLITFFTYIVAKEK